MLNAWGDKLTDYSFSKLLKISKEFEGEDINVIPCTGKIQWTNTANEYRNEYNPALCWPNPKSASNSSAAPTKQGSMVSCDNAEVYFHARLHFPETSHFRKKKKKIISSLLSCDRGSMHDMEWKPGRPQMIIQILNAELTWVWGLLLTLGFLAAFFM